MSRVCPMSASPTSPKSPSSPLPLSSDRSLDSDPSGVAVEDSDDSPACVLVFNANDPSGSGGLSGDITAVASVGGHALPVVTGAYVRDTAEIVDFYAFDDEAVTDQARAVLEDMRVQVIKVGFVGSPENLSAIAEIAADFENPVAIFQTDPDSVVAVVEQ